MNIIIKNFILLFFMTVTDAQHMYRLCAPESISETTCFSLSRGDSQVSCIRVTDSADCAIKLNENKVDIGIFNAEELLLAYQFYPNTLTPLAQLRNREKLKDDFEFHTVAVVPMTFNGNEGLAGLKNQGLCHPGFSESQIWNDYILKFFEKKVYNNECQKEYTASENEARNLKNFFGKACRPGIWVPDASQDDELKKNYPELCELCDNKSECKYENNIHHGHMGALECLTSGRGNVAYVAYHYVQQYFNLNQSNPMPLINNPGYQFLCPNGSLQPLTKTNPCSWIQQPWSVILTRKDDATEIISSLKEWIVDPLTKSESWKVALSRVIQEDGLINYFSEPPSLRSYLITGREVELSEKSCGKSIRWCTINKAEMNKCNWVMKEAELLGIEPKFTCEITNSTFECLQYISKNQSDIMAIDSNYGYLARRLYNLSTVLYVETEKDKNSAVIAVIRERSKLIDNFSDLKDKTICFPDYGGIAWLSFINIVRNKKLIGDTCDYPKAVAKLLSGACTPGINDTSRSEVKSDFDAVSILCSACPLEKPNSTCSADANVNMYYGDKGALECLKGPGDIAFIELKNIIPQVRVKKIEPSEFRVLCKNESFAEYTGFNVDENCALSVTIDSEVIGRTNNSKVDSMDMTFALLKLEDWLGYRAYSRRVIRIYDSFLPYDDLLFKDSTVGLESKDSEIKSIMAYKDLFKLVDSCRSASVRIFSYLFLILSTLIVLCLC
ncbi:transferrin-like [Chelonus insularis]|uniref:transferrin-like n=1 Tax=Chelonus insularis TaxID=460826 RepID=UPI00158B3818|nr:transferrin-like [Chelonus insularis]